MLIRPLRHLLFCAAVTAGAIAAEQPLALDAAQSRIEVAVKATVDSFTARLNHFEPVILVDDAGRITTARLTFQFRDLVTGKDKRDAAMHKWQQTDAFPSGSFELTALTPQAENRFNAAGRLTLHGVTREVQFPVTISRQGDVYALSGDVTLDTREFGLPVIRMYALLKVDPMVQVRFQLQGRSRS